MLYATSVVLDGGSLFSLPNSPAVAQLTCVGRVAARLCDIAKCAGHPSEGVFVISEVFSCPRSSASEIEDL